jgi:hypothetical protein
VRIGEILAAMPKAKPGPKELSNSVVTQLNTKEETIKKLGFKKTSIL